MPLTPRTSRSRGSRTAVWSRSRGGSPTQAARHFGPQLGEVRRCRRRERPDDDVGAGGDLGKCLGADRFQSTPDGVAGHGCSHLLAHDETEPRRAVFGGGDDVRHRVHCGATGTPADDGFVLRPAGDAIPARQHFVRSAGSGRKLGATLGATRREDSATGTRAHAGTEPVLLGATAVVGLESALGHEDHSGSACHPNALDRGHRYRGLPMWA
jgi:hypothetical protein